MVFNKNKLSRVEQGLGAVDDTSGVGAVASSSGVSSTNSGDGGGGEAGNVHGVRGGSISVATDGVDEGSSVVDNGSSNGDGGNSLNGDGGSNGHYAHAVAAP